MAQHVLSHARDGLLFVCIDRPEVKNAVNGPCARELYKVFEHFDRDDSLRVAILSGSKQTFCAGADLKAIAGSTDVNQGDFNPFEPEGDLGPMGPTRLQLNKPVIAAIEGYAVAGGLELALWCDLRVVADDATLGVFCRRFGVPLVDGGTVRLPRLIGQSRAMDLVLTGRPVAAQEALDIGLANYLAPSGKTLEQAEVVARQIMRHPQACMQNDRKSLLEQWCMNEAAAIRNEFKHGQATFSAGETQAGAKAFTSGAGRHGKPRQDS